MKNVDSSRVGLGTQYHFEKLISSPIGPEDQLQVWLCPITCCVTVMISHPQTSASLSLKAEVDEVFISPPTSLSSPPSLHQRPFLSLSLGVWNLHLDLILWVHPHQISIYCFLALLSFLHMLMSFSLCVLLNTFPSLSTLS